MDQSMKLESASYDALFEHTHDAVFLIGLDGKFIKINRKAQEMLGYTEHEQRALAAQKPRQSQQHLEPWIGLCREIQHEDA